MYSLLENISEQRFSNILAGADEIQARFKDFLRNGLFRFAQNVVSQSDLLKRRLIDCQAPGLASMVSSLADVDFSSEFWKEQFVSSFSKIYMTASALKNIHNLDPVWQNELLVLSGVSFPQQQVLETKPVKDTWMVLAIIKEPFNSMIVKRTWMIGQYTNRFAVYVQFITNEHSDEFKVKIGNCVTTNFYFYEGIHSMRVLFKSYATINSNFSPKAYSGCDIALRIFRKALTDNPFMLFIPLILTDISLAVKDRVMYLIDSNFNSIPVSISCFQKLNLLTYTGGKKFSCFVLIYQFYSKIVSVWSDNKFYFLDYEID